MVQIDMAKSLFAALSGHGGRVVLGVSRARAVVGDTDLPDKVDVVVIGGGYVGVCAAFTLASRGLRVALCEKGVIAGEASGRSLGWIDSQFLDPAKMDLIARSKELWEGMNAAVGAETGYRKSGVVSLLADKGAQAFAEGWLDKVRGRRGVDARIVSAQEAAALMPGCTGSFVGGLYQPSDACAEPVLAAPAIAEGARRHGAILLQHCAVRGVETSGGAISGVVTERGRIGCQAVVLAGGYWSSLFARSLGIALPQFQANASMMAIRPPGEGLPETCAWGNGYVWRRQIDGAYTIGAINGVSPVTPDSLRHLFRLLPAIKAMWNEVDPVFNWRTFLDDLRRPTRWRLDEVTPFERNRILMPEVRQGYLDAARRRLEHDFPAFAGAQALESWGGVLVTTLDNMPVLSGVPALPGLFLGTGFYYGLTMGPAAGEALADLVMGRTPQFDLHDYRFQRFSDGSRLVFRT
jgi:glycine/D-amino acid oxidase-like deaminating enzyme